MTSAVCQISRVLLVLCFGCTIGCSGREDDNRPTPDIYLSAAAINGDAKAAAEAISKGAHVNSMVKDMSPMMAAAAFAKPDMVRLLLENGADPNLANSKGMTALMFAKGGITATLLLNAGSDINAQSRSQGRTALIGAAEDGDLDTINVFLNYGAALDAQDHDGVTALIMAASKDRIDLVERLVEAGADVNLKMRDGRTVILFLMLAKAADSPAYGRVRKLVIDKLVDVNAEVGYRGSTALIMAALTKRKEAVRVLLARGADTQIKDAAGLTALDYATALGQTEMVQLLTSAASVEAPVVSPAASLNAGQGDGKRGGVTAYQDLLAEEAVFPRGGKGAFRSVEELKAALGLRAAFIVKLDKALASAEISKQQYDELVLLNRRHSFGQ